MERQSGASPTIWRRIRKFISHPITGFSVGVIGIVLAVYFYFDGITKPNLVLLIHPVRTPIVQAGKLSEISVLLHDKPIHGDLTAAQFVIWNSGKAPVRHDDILTPIVLTTSNNCPIYEATIRSVSRDVIAFQLGTNEMAFGRLSFDWKILEHNDGASIQILYGGDQKMPLTELSGIVVGQNHIPFQVLNVSGKTFMSTVGASLIMFVLGVCFAGGAKECFKDLNKAVDDRKWQSVVGNALGVGGCAVLAILLCIGAFNAVMAKNAPPFGF